MATINQNFTMYEGNSKKIVVALTDEDSGKPTNLMDMKIRWGMKRSPYDEQIVAMKEIGTGVTVTGKPGEFIVSLVPEDTEGQIGVFHHEAEIEDILGNVTTVMTGSITVKKAAI